MGYLAFAEDFLKVAHQSLCDQIVFLLFNSIASKSIIVPKDSPFWFLNKEIKVFLKPATY